jgi:hypothetical protein
MGRQKPANILPLIPNAPGGRPAPLFQPALLCVHRIADPADHPHDIISHHGVLKDQSHFIAKPFTIDTLALTVRQVLDE